MKILKKVCLTVLFLTTVIACKETKKEVDTVAQEAIEKVESVETELEAVTEELEKKAKELDDSLNALDDI